MKEIYIQDVPGKIARMLTLLDRNPVSKTFGCFDRNFWHYKIKDFPSGMSQEFVGALALVYSTQFPENIFYQNERLRHYIEGALNFTASSAHPDGSTDDYFPYERALGAAVFSLHAATESYRLLGLHNEELLDFFSRRAEWIMHHHESGRLANHHAIASLCLLNVAHLTGKKVFQERAEERMDQVLSWQTAEGWYLEYEGCDPGYLSVTIDFLAQFYKRCENARLLTSLNKAVDFFYEVQHPDGSLGGDYSSRCTAIFHPNGFELLAPQNPKAERIANSYLKAKESGRLAIVEDDYIMGHGLISNLMAFRNVSRRDFKDLNEPASRQPGKFMSESGFYLARQGKCWAIFNLKKGGSGKIYKGDQLVYVDSGLLVQEEKKIPVSSLVDSESAIEVEKDGFKVRKRLMRYQQHFASPFLFLILRLLLITLGPLKSTSHWLRVLLQKKMVIARKRDKAEYEREVRWSEKGIRIHTRVSPVSSKANVFLSRDLVPMVTAVSECFESHSLEGDWQRLSVTGPEISHEELIS